MEQKSAGIITRAEADYIDGQHYGNAQSPINIVRAVSDGKLDPLRFDYKTTPVDLVNTGFTIQFNYAPGSTLTFQGQVYELVQFHFHAPAEHAINGIALDMCAHLVHRSTDRKLAVVGIQFGRGVENPTLAAFWGNLPVGQWNVRLDRQINVAALLPEDRRYYTYTGSLTTFPYTEGVRWLILESPVTVSVSQVRKFVSICGENARPYQPTNHRPVYHSTTQVKES